MTRWRTALDDELPHVLVSMVNPELDMRAKIVLCKICTSSITTQFWSHPIQVDRNEKRTTSKPTLPSSLVEVPVLHQCGLQRTSHDDDVSLSFITSYNLSAINFPRPLCTHNSKTFQLVESHLVQIHTL